MHGFSRFVCPVVFLALIAFLPLGGIAQNIGAGPRGRADVQGANAAPVRIREVAGANRRELVPTPQYSSNVSRGRAQPGLWGQFITVYDTEPEWMDELVFQYYVLCHNSRVKDNAYSLFKGSVSYIDIPRGREHLSAMYMRPSAVLRYGQIVAVAVEVVYRGETVAKRSVERDPKVPADWWKTNKLTARDGYLLNKSQTPFAFVNYDDEESIK